MAINLQKGTTEVSEVFSDNRNDIRSSAFDNYDRGNTLTYSDINDSFMFGRMHDMSPAIKQGQTPDGLLNVLAVLFAGQCKKYADKNPDFEGSLFLKELSIAHNEENYQRFADLVLVVYPMLCERASSKKDLDAMALVAGVDTLRGEIETANLNLREILVENANGRPLSEDSESFWMFVATTTDFESWLKLHDGIYLTGDSKFNNRDRYGNPIQNDGGSQSSHSSSNRTPTGKLLLVAGIILMVIIVGASIINSKSHYSSSDNYYYDENDDVDMNDDDYSYSDEDYPNNGNDSYYVIGNSYQIQTNLRVREGPGKEYRILNRDELSPEDYENSVDSKTTTDALMEEGKTVLCLGMEGDWMRIESGWICVYDEGEVLVR